MKTLDIFDISNTSDTGTENILVVLYGKDSTEIMPVNLFSQVIIIRMRVFQPGFKKTVIPDIFGNSVNIAPGFEFMNLLIKIWAGKP